MNYGLGSNDHVEKYIGLVTEKIDRIGDRYYVYIPNLLQYNGMLICWNQIDRYYWLEGNTSYGQYMPLQAGTAVAVEFYDKDYNTGYITGIVPGTVTTMSGTSSGGSETTPPTTPSDNITPNSSTSSNSTSLFSANNNSSAAATENPNPTDPQNQNRPSITTPPTNIPGQRLDPNDRDKYNMLFKNKNMSMFTVYEEIKNTQFQKVIQAEKKTMLGDNGLAIDDRSFKNHMEFHYLGIDLYTELPFITLKAEKVIRLKAPIICLDGQVFMTANAVAAGTVEENKGVGLTCTNGPFDAPPEDEDKDFDQRMADWLAKITAPTGGGRGACWGSDAGNLKTHHATGPGDVLTYFWCKGATYVDMDDGCTGNPTRVNKPDNFVCPI
jgi:hypothetical protein